MKAVAASPLENGVPVRPCHGGGAAVGAACFRSATLTHISRAAIPSGLWKVTAPVSRSAQSPP